MMTNSKALSCRQCGYDLFGLPPDGDCPECSTHYKMTLTTEQSNITTVKISLSAPITFSIGTIFSLFVLMRLLKAGVFGWGIPLLFCYMLVPFIIAVVLSSKSTDKTAFLRYGLTVIACLAMSPLVLAPYNGMFFGLLQFFILPSAAVSGVMLAFALYSVALRNRT